MQLALSVAIERRGPDWSDPEYGYRLRRLKKQIRTDPTRSLLIMLGSSRVANGFDTDCIPPATWSGKESPLIFNMSLSGGTLFSELVILKRLLSAGIHPRWLVIEVLPASLTEEGKVLEAINPLATTRLRWTDLEVLERHAHRSPWHWHRKWLKDCVASWYVNRDCFLARYAPSWLEPKRLWVPQFIRHDLTPCGWLPFPFETVSKEDYKDGFRVARKAYGNQLASFHIVAEADRILREMLEICHREGIQVIGLLCMPEASDFRGLYSPETCRLIDGYLESLCRENQTEFINATTWVDDKYFKDGHHLLPPGAEQFSLRLWNEVLQRRITKTYHLASTGISAK